MNTLMARHSDRNGSGGILRRLALGAAIGLVISGASVLWVTPAAAGHDEIGIYCQLHRGHFAPAHYRHHAVGYVLAGPAGYRFYPGPSYARLARAYYGYPALYVSRGYFYPQWIGYGPVYEPYGYFGISGLRIGNAHLGFQIGLPAFPTVGVRFLAHPPHGPRFHARHHHHHRRRW
jgi:hypothetical protein